jgi:hypothetical protein
MPTTDAPAPQDAPDTSNTGEESNDTGETDADGPGESTTPQEVQQILGNSGMKIDLPVEAADDTAEDEDASEEDADPATDTPADAPVEEPEPETEDAPAEEEAADDTPPADVKDFSMTVEDAEGVTHKINAGDRLDDVLADFDPKNNGQIMQIIYEFGKLEADKAAYDAEQTENAAREANDARISEIQAGWQKDIELLQGDKRLPMGEEGDTRVQEVYNFMGEENAKRAEAGRAPITSFEDAFDKLELRESRAAEAEAKKVDKDDARRRGSFVGGSSSAATTAPKAYRPGSARTASEAVRSLGLL